MSSQQSNTSPVFRLYVKGADVTVRFSKEESEDVKCRVRDILTGAYGERLQRKKYCTGVTYETGLLSIQSIDQETGG